MLKVGLTGGIASGKSTVSGMFRELGAHIIDADVLAREALEPGLPAYHETIKVFGRRIAGSDGRIDRRALGKIVFGDPERRRALEAIVHPRVFEEEARIFGELSARDPHGIAIFDAALLIEAGAHARMDRVVLVWCREETQVARMVEKWGLTREEAVVRVRAQMSLDEKKKYADYVIDNDGDIARTREQVARIYSELNNNLTSS